MSVTVEVIDDFADIDDGLWHEVAGRSATDVVFTTLEWQRAWWAVLGRGRLRLLLARRQDEPVAIAPLFVDGEMAFFVGAGGSDYLDLIGDVSDAEVLDRLLLTARDAWTGLLGFHFHHVPDESPTGGHLTDAARRLGWTIHDEGDLPAPYLDRRAGDEAWDRAVAKKSLRRSENYFRREGQLVVEHLRAPEDVLPHLDAFFDQHVARWAGRAPSLFEDPGQRALYRHLAAAGPAWLRFTRVVWDGRAVASHFGFCHAGRYLWYKPSFDIDLARWSPGEVLLRHLLVAARDEGAVELDFGLGDEAFKARFATGTRTVRTWGVYPDGD